MEAFLGIVADIKEVLSSGLFITLVILCSLYFSLRMIFPQFRFLKQSFKAMFESPDSKDGISPFQAFATALGARVGVGNIAGIASAISIGGPGAIFWIWIFGVFGSGLAVAESIAGQIYKIKDGDEFLGGPPYYIKMMFGGGKLAKFIAAFYACVGIIGVGVFLSGVQSNTVVDSIANGLGADRTMTITIAALVIALVIWGGIKRIGAFEGVFTPIKLTLYFGFAIIVIGFNFDKIIPCFVTIFQSALGINAIFGAIVGEAISMGVRRGIFSTDVGYGAGAAFSAVARTNHPVKQGLLQGLSVLISTLIICTLSGLILLSTDAYQVATNNGANIIYTGGLYTGTEAGATWVQAALNSVPILHGWAPQALAVLIAIFAAGTIIGYYYLTENNLRYLMKGTNKKAIFILKLFYLVGMVASTMISADAIWDFADIGLAVMCIVNLICMLFLSPKIIQVIKDYSAELKSGSLKPFNPEKYGFKDTTGAWDIK